MSGSDTLTDERVKGCVCTIACNVFHAANTWCQPVHDEIKRRFEQVRDKRLRTLHRNR